MFSWLFHTELGKGTMANECILAQSVAFVISIVNPDALSCQLLNLSKIEPIPWAVPQLQSMNTDVWSSLLFSPQEEVNTWEFSPISVHFGKGRDYHEYCEFFYRCWCGWICICLGFSSLLTGFWIFLRGNQSVYCSVYLQRIWGFLFHIADITSYFTIYIWKILAITFLGSIWLIFDIT